ncbi:hypothetical protein ACFE04_002009 [Oxalis oulophora]
MGSRALVEEFAPKITQVIHWFGQLQAIDLTGVQPSIRPDTQGENLRQDIPVIFDDREAILSAVPTYEEPYIKVPKQFGGLLAMLAASIQERESFSNLSGFQPSKNLIDVFSFT